MEIWMFSSAWDYWGGGSPYYLHNTSKYLPLLLSYSFYLDFSKPQTLDHQINKVFYILGKYKHLETYAIEKPANHDCIMATSPHQIILFQSKTWLCSRCHTGQFPSSHGEKEIEITSEATSGFCVLYSSRARNALNHYNATLSEKKLVEFISSYKIGLKTCPNVHSWPYFNVFFLFLQLLMCLYISCHQLFFSILYKPSHIYD